MNGTLWKKEKAAQLQGQRAQELKASDSIPPPQKLAGLPNANNFNPLNLKVLICKMRITMIPTL